MIDVGYAICTTPRSGGTLLRELLRERGLGRPFEHLHPDVVRASCRTWKIDPSGYLDRLWETQTVDGVFGTMLHWTHLDALAHLEPRVPLVTWADVFPGTVRRSAAWILLERDDVLSQARSFATALRTGDWTRPGVPYDDSVPLAEVELHAERFRRQQTAWAQYVAGRFLFRTVRAMYVRAEALFADPAGTADEVAAFVRAGSDGIFLS